MKMDYDKVAALVWQLASWRAGVYDWWREVGMILHAVAGDDAELAARLLQLWIEWSEQSASEYEPGICEKKWTTFRATGDNRVGIGTLRLRVQEDQAADTSASLPIVDGETDADSLQRTPPDELAELNARFLPNRTAKRPPATAKPSAKPVATSDLRPLAVQLGVSTNALVSLGVNRSGSHWRIPERDASGRIIGYATRGDDGSKGFVKGGNRGLTMQWPLPANAGTSRDDPILLVEGMSDTAAGLDLGFTTIGRPSATGGLEYLPEVVANRHVIIIGENDGGAGRLGVDKCSDTLLGIAASVRVVYPPAEHKDVRQWKNA